MAERIIDSQGNELDVQALGQILVDGLIAAGVADAGNPVKIGGVYNSTKPTLTTGQRGDAQLGTRGALLAQLMANDSPSPVTVAGPADALTAGLTALIVAAVPQLFNGASFDRQRVPTIFKPFASTAITAGTGATIWTPTAGKKFRLMGWLISSSVAGQLIFGDNAVGTVIARSEAVAAAGVSKAGSGDIGNGILSAAANNVLKLDGPTGNVAGMVWGTEE